MQAGIILQGIGHQYSCLYLALVVHAEGHRLEPHHASEVALQLLCTAVVASRTEETVGELHVLVIQHEVAEAVLR